MAPSAETNVVGRHGVVGQDILSHDPDLHMPVEIGQEYADMVDEMDRRVRETLARERQLDLEKQATTQSSIERRAGELAVMSLVSVEATAA